MTVATPFPLTVQDTAKMDTNPSYEVSKADTIKMETNPSYEVSASGTKGDPAYQTMSGGASTNQLVKMTQSCL